MTTTPAPAPQNLAPPPDKDAENALLRMRVQAAEAALYAFEEGLRGFLETTVQPTVKQMHALNKKFPIGDDTTAGAQLIAVNAIRAAMPEHRGKTDAELLAMYFKEKT
jgi:hypothetical protein